MRTTTMADEGSKGSRVSAWRITFGRRIAADPLYGRTGEVVEGWIETDNPERLKARVALSAWHADPPLRLTAFGGATGREAIASVTCTTVDIANWDPAASTLPTGDVAAPPPSSPARDRLALMRALRAALDTAVAASVIGDVERGGLMLLASKAVAQRGPLGTSPPFPTS